MTEFQVVFCDGTVPNLPRGFYWRTQVGAGHYGGMHGPFDTEEIAKREAENNTILKMVSGEAPHEVFTIVKPKR